MTKSLREDVEELAKRMRAGSFELFTVRGERTPEILATAVANTLDTILFKHSATESEDRAKASPPAQDSDRVRQVADGDEDALNTREQRLQYLCAAMYQAAGAFDMPVRFLDILSKAGNGEDVTQAELDALLSCDCPSEGGIRRTG